MKWLALILSLYIFSLSSIPCVDEGNHVCANYSAQSADQHSTNDNNQPGTCSPFCVCACCNVSVVISNYYCTNNPFRLMSISYVPLYEHITSNYHVAIWQPPKVS